MSSQANDTTGWAAHCLRMVLVATALLWGPLVVAVAPAHAVTPAPEQSLPQFEILFLDHMVDESALAVELTAVCAARADHVELQRLCAERRADQSRTSVLMQAWLHAWYGIDPDPQIAAADRQQIAHLAKLHGAALERTLMTALLERHSRSAAWAGECLDRAEHGALVELCRDIGTTQRTAAAQLTGWLCDWYALCER